MAAPALPHALLDAAGLAALEPAGWDALAAAALVENPFYARPHVLAGLATIDSGRGVRALAIRAADGALAGLFPFGRRGLVPMPGTAFGAANRYQFCGTPLVHRDHAAEVVDTWLGLVARGVPHGLWVLPDIDLATPLAGLIRDGAAARRMAVRPANPYQRAFLTRLPDGFEAHLGAVLSKNRLKDVRRTMRRLHELGTIDLEQVHEAGPVAARLEDFLRLEHAGWKGEKGTSFLSRPADAAFARQAYAAPLAAIDSLLLDGTPIAMKLSIRTGDTAFTPKIAYDERHRKLGPGMALEYALIEAFYAAGRPGAVDAAATAEGHSALNFFNAYKEMATLIVGRSRWRMELLARLYAGRERLKHRLKALAARVPGGTPHG
ncbi:GNAT family N-acetyltransferase [Devosia sp.]|uniref:GNAT family N-acetyltransferase n=1 Tax=Devosia sp. TaxID=1871048 RepID=UPI002EE6D9E1